MSIASLPFRLPAGEPRSLAPAWITQENLMVHLENESEDQREDISYFLPFLFSLASSADGVNKFLKKIFRIRKWFFKVVLLFFATFNYI